MNIIKLICNIDFSPLHHTTALLIRAQKLIALTALFISQALQHTSYFNLILKVFAANCLLYILSIYQPCFSLKKKFFQSLAPKKQY